MIIYLYVKQHIITGLKYFGKTLNNPFKYPGSGTYWKNHCKKHGKKYIKTIEIWGFDDQKLCTQFALKFSKQNNIVESEEWANLIPEDGIGFTLTELQKLKVSITSKNRKPWNSGLSGYKRIPYGKQKNPNPNRNNPRGKRGKQKNPRIGKPQSTIMCPHCNKTGGVSAMKRYHFDNCALKLVNIG